MNPDYIAQDLKKEFPKIRLARVGSSIVPNVTPKDYDILVCIAIDMKPLVKYLEAIGYKVEGSQNKMYPPNTGFVSLRNKNINFIITCDGTFFDTFKKASGLCRDLGLTERDDRVLVHKAILRKNEKIDVEKLRLKHMCEAMLIAASDCIMEGSMKAAKTIIWNAGITHEEAANCDVSNYDFERISKLMEWSE